MTDEKAPAVVEPEVASTTAPEATELRIVHEVNERRISAAFTSPFPPAAELERLKTVDPRLVSLLIESYKAEIDHRHAMERGDLEAQASLAKRGQIFGYSMALASLVAGVALVLYGASAAGVAALIGSVAAVAGPFIYRAIVDRRSGPNEGLSGE